jgi:membrane associated rhomboid family serine protease
MQFGTRKEARQERGPWSLCMVRAKKVSMTLSMAPSPRAVVVPYFVSLLLSVFFPLGDADQSSGYAGLGNSSAIGPQMVGAVVSAFLDALYKA